METSSKSISVHQSAHRTTSAPFAGEMLSNSVMGSCPNEPATPKEEHHPHRSVISPFNQIDDGGNQSDSSNSNSSLASSPRYNERHPRAFENFRRNSGSGRSGGNNSSSTRGSFVKLGSRTSLPPLDENCPLDATESQLSLNLRRATRSSSWTNQKILDAIDGLNTNIEDLDPCRALGGKVPTSYIAPDDTSSKPESSRQGSFEKFVLPKSISNLVMKSRSSGSVNPPTSAQNRENSCYNFLSGIREDEDEEQNQDHAASSVTAGIRLTITPATSISSPTEESQEKSGASIEQHHHRHSKNGNFNTKDHTVKRKVLTQQQHHHHHRHQPQQDHLLQERNFSEEKGTSQQQQGALPQQANFVECADKQRYHQQHLAQQNPKTIIQSSSTSTITVSDSEQVCTKERPRSEQKLEQDNTTSSVVDHNDGVDDDRKSKQQRK